MNPSSPNNRKLIIAWIAGVIFFIVIGNLLSRIEFLNDLRERPAGLAQIILEVMIAVWFGMFIKTGKLNGGLSHRSSRRFNRWIVVVIVLGIVGEIAEVLLNLIFGELSLLEAILIFLSPVIVGVLLLESNSKWIDKNIPRILKWINELDLLPTKHDK